MLYTVTVSFGTSNEYEFKLSEDEVQSLPRDEASTWLNGEFEELDCAPRSPVGKILLLDVIIDVAKYGGESRFSENGDWARRFARCCCAALKRETIRIDTVGMVVR